MYQWSCIVIGRKQVQPEEPEGETPPLPLTDLGEGTHILLITVVAKERGEGQKVSKDVPNHPRTIVRLDKPENSDYRLKDASLEGTSGQ